METESSDECSSIIKKEKHADTTNSDVDVPIKIDKHEYNIKDEEDEKDIKYEYIKTYVWYIKISLYFGLILNCVCQLEMMMIYP